MNIHVCKNKNLSLTHQLNYKNKNKCTLDINSEHKIYSVSFTVSFTLLCSPRPLLPLHPHLPQASTYTCTHTHTHIHTHTHTHSLPLHSPMTARPLSTAARYFWVSTPSTSYSYAVMTGHSGSRTQRPWQQSL